MKVLKSKVGQNKIINKIKTIREMLLNIFLNNIENHDVALLYFFKLMEKS